MFYFLSTTGLFSRLANSQAIVKQVELSWPISILFYLSICFFYGIGMNTIKYKTEGTPCLQSYNDQNAHKSD
jgi:hypothetical protein